MEKALRHLVILSDDEWWSWIFRDRFTDGDKTSLNGTYSSDGKAKRVEVDTEGKASISSNLLTFSGGKAVPAYDDPAIHYTNTDDSLFALGSGLAFLVSYQITTTSGEMLFGGNDDAASSPYNPRVYLHGGDVAFQWSASSADFFSQAINTTETLMIVRRSSTHGALFFRHITGDSWKLLFVDTTAHVQATGAISLCNHSASILKASEIGLGDLSSRVTADFAEQSGLDATPAEGETITRPAARALIDFGAITLPGTDPIKIAIRWIDADNNTNLYANADGSGNIKETVGGVEGASLGSCAAGVITAADLKVLDNGGSVSVFSALTLAFTATLTDHEEATSVKITSLGT
jgi:hypothetical protein